MVKRPWAGFSSLRRGAERATWPAVIAEKAASMSAWSSELGMRGSVSLARCPSWPRVRAGREGRGTMVPVRLELGVAGVLRLLEIGVSIAEPVSTS
jgi:hypothetical protein